MASKLSYILLCCGVLLLNGCTTRFVDFTIISTKNVDLSRAGSFQKSSTRTDGIDKAYIIIFIPTGNPNLKEAIDRAIEAVPGAVALLDGVVTSGFFYIPYVYGEASFTVEGTALLDPAQLPKQAQATTPYMIAALDKSGNVAFVNHVTKTEYDAAKSRIAAGGMPKN